MRNISICLAFGKYYSNKGIKTSIRYKGKIKKHLPINNRMGAGRREQISSTH